ncbi:MAG: hypothetical protein IK086_01425 [Clostridia bacterium]|nr:hypothetical protein [Clostridia bacterium]
MSFAQVLRTLFEVALVLFAIWAVFHENIFIAFEQRIVAHFKRKQLKVINGASVHRVR